ncbi:MAG: SLC13 family permease, partial [Methyloceanibacter sp.]
MPEPEQISDRLSLRQLIGLVAGPVCFAALAVSPPPSGLSEPGWAVAALAVWMAVWWATEAVPLFVTALLPLVLLPLFGVLDVRQAATPFGHPVVFLMLGGFLIGLALERWNLHRRIALHTIMCFGGRPTNLVAGKMLATAFLSMWITNTATTIMVLPIAISLIGAVVPDGKAGSREATNFATAMVLGIAYAASIGGMGSLVGSPTNLLAASYLDQTFGIELTFAGWMAVALPIAVVLLGLAYLVLTRIAFPISNSLGEAKTDVAGEMLREMGPMSVPERRVAIIFAVVAAAWIFR